MDTDLLYAPRTPRFVRDVAPDPVRDELAGELELERARRLRAERVANDLARLVAAESRRALDEEERRLDAERTASSMAALVAHENARARRAEAHLRELLQGSAAPRPRPRRAIGRS
jgi:hypothetical protein